MQSGSCYSFFTADKLGRSVTSSTYNSEANYFVDKEGKLENANISRLPKFNVNVTGYMVQADNVEKDEAVKELTALVQK